MALRDSDPAEVGGYRIEDRLGSGGMGVVYLARSASGRRLAVKVVHGQYADDDEFRARFRREVDAARQVSGAFTAPVVDADADAPRPWMATLHIPGADLGTHVRVHGPLPPPRARELAAGLAEALRDIHRAGVVHRDLKPANVMLADDGPRVIDFGISRATGLAASDALTQTGRVMGTPPYMSPEQFSAPHEVGPAADIFSLGAVVAFAASGKGPFDSPSPYETAIRVVEGTPELADVPEELLPFIHLCLDKEPKSRPSADELLRLLRDGTLPASDPPTLVDAPRPRRRRGHPWLLTALGTALVAAVATTTLALTDDDADPGRLPAGWEAWHRQAKDPSVHKDPMGPTTLFNRCVASGTSLVCAGDEIMATRFALADGANTWGRPMDPTAEDADLGSAGSGAGTIIGARGGRVYVYGADDRPGDDETPYSNRYTIQALDAGTGRVAWKTVTADSADGTEPNSDQGASAAVPAGVVTVYGRTGRQYALLDAETGKVRWKRPLPNPNQYMSLLRSVGGQAYLLTARYTSDVIENTNVSELDPATGKPRWTVNLKGDANIVGRRDGRLLLLNTTGARRTLTLIKTSTHIVTTVQLAQPQPEAATPTLTGGTLYFTLATGGIRAVDPDTGRQLWEGNSGVELAGPPIASGTHLYLASPSGRLAAVNRTTGRVDGTLDGRDEAAVDGSPTGAPLTLVGDALYVPYGRRSVYTVDIRTL